MSLADLGLRISENTAAAEPSAVSLSSFMASVANKVSTVPTTWVRAEIAQMKDTRHLYLELVENSEEGAELAKCRGVMWAGKRTSLLARFKEATGGHLSSGMKVLIQVSASFHAQYGFSLVIENIDPSYTLGDMQRKLTDIQNRLKNEGLFENNRRLLKPDEFTHVAVIAPDEAAGLGDFKATASYLEKYGLCRFDYFTALFQGNAVTSSLCTAIHNVQLRHESKPYDAVVIIRGGGAVTDLAQLNEYQVAKSVCILNVPVLSGIGHEKDNTIIDLVSNQRFDTPSKVIAHIMDTIIHNARDAQTQWQHVWNTWQQQKRNTVHLLDNLVDQIKSSVRIKLQSASADTNTHHQQVIQESRRIINVVPKDIIVLIGHIVGSAKGILNQAHIDIEQEMSTVSSKAKQNLQRANGDIESNMGNVRHAALSQLTGARKEVNQLMEYVTGMGPRQTLKRGYAIVRSEGKIIGSAEVGNKCKDVDIEFHDGQCKFSNGEK